MKQSEPKGYRTGKCQLVYGFFKEEFEYILAYLIGNSVIILFYTLLFKHQVEVCYPLMLSLSILCIHLIFRFYRYRIRLAKLKVLKLHRVADLTQEGESERKIYDTINAVHDTYTGQLMTMKEEYQEEKRLLSMAIHNLKTPVAVTSLILQRLENGEMNPDTAVEDLLTENTRLQEELNNLLELNRYTEAVNDFTPAMIDLVAEVRLLINQNRSLFIHNRVYPKLTAKKEVIMVIADTKWNRVMIRQFLSNAVKYSYESDEERGQKTIELTISEDGVLKIQDHGIGIEEHDLLRVCEPFFTGENGRKQYQSSGIGLYLCDKICSMLKASMSITSQIGQGTTVTVKYLTKLKG